jgi:hypothetical protein
MRRSPVCFFEKPFERMASSSLVDHSCDLRTPDLGTAASWAILCVGLFLATGLAGCAGQGVASVEICVQSVPHPAFTHVFLSFSRIEVRQMADGEKLQPATSGMPSPANVTGAAQNGTARVGSVVCHRVAETSASDLRIARAAAKIETDLVADHGWMTMVRQGRIDVNNYSRNDAASMGVVPVPIGSYAQLGVLVLEAGGVLANGTQVPIAAPSDAILLDQHWTVLRDERVRLVLLFDLAGGLRQSNATWTLQPKASLEIIHLTDGKSSGDSSHAEAGQTLVSATSESFPTPTTPSSTSGGP